MATPPHLFHRRRLFNPQPITRRPAEWFPADLRAYHHPKRLIRAEMYVITAMKHLREERISG
jgi:hypothetical protein